MKSENSGNVYRREFVKAGVLSAAALSVGFRSSIRAVLAQARGAGKPALTEGNFNKLIPEDANRFKRLALEAKQDLKAFIKKNFYLTDSQNQKLEALTKAEINLIT